MNFLLFRFFILLSFWFILEFPSLVRANLLVPSSQEQLSLTYAPVVKKVSPSVVNIYAARVVKNQVISPFFNDPFFKHFFGDNLISGSPYARIQNSLGSGVIVRSDGIIITNYHVIQQAEEIKVVLSDGREFMADVVVRDARTDLAALKIKGVDQKFPALELRDADELQVGDIVLAVGNPFGFGQTVTSGIISGLARSEMGVKDFRSLIQTDAAVNPGNSGGPLISLDGRIVGINTAIFSNTGASIGISFAIPSNLVVPILAGVDRGGKIIRPWAGLTIKSLNRERAQTLGLALPKGVLVTKVFKDTPAERAGVQPGDVILHINNHEILNEASYRFRMATGKTGEKMEFMIWRAQKLQKVTLIPEIPPDVLNNKPLEVPGRNPLSGAVVVTLSPAVSSDLGIAYDEQGGAVIIHIRPDSLAAFSGLLPGDTIMNVNGKPIPTADQLLRNLTRSRKGWEITFSRGGKVYVQQW